MKAINNQLQTTPFFIVAAPRSGTTLLERMLNRHSEIFIPPETAFFFLLTQYGFIDRGFDAGLAEEAIDFYLTTKPAQLLSLNKISGVKDRLLFHAESFTDIFLNLLLVLSEDMNCTIVGEKTPHHLRCLPSILKGFPEPKIIAVVRDGRAVVKSHVNQPNWEDNLLAAAQMWSSDMDLLRKLLEGSYSQRVYLITYENLLRQPERELMRVCDFIGVEYQETMLDDSVQIPDKFKDYYQQSWMSKSVTRIDPLRSESWRKEYLPSELAMVEKVIGDRLKYLGYQPEGPATGWLLPYMRDWSRHKLYRLRVRLARLRDR